MDSTPEPIVVKVEVEPQLSGDEEWEDQNLDEDSLLTSVDSESFGEGTVIKVEVEERYSSSDDDEEEDGEGSQSPQEEDGEGSRSPQEEEADGDDGDWKQEIKPDVRMTGRRSRRTKISADQEKSKYASGSSNKGLTEEELRAKRAFLARQRRQKKKEQMMDEDLKQKTEERKYAKASSNKGLTPDEVRAKKREMQRRRRERIRSQLTEEELEELKRKEREKKRALRARYKKEIEEEENEEVDSVRRTRNKGSLAESLSGDEEDGESFVKKECKDDNDDDYEPHEDSEKTPRKSKKDMSRAELRKYWREEALARRRRKRAAMTPEQREEVLRKERERKRELRGSFGRGTVKREGGVDPSERRRREAEARRLKRQAMTEEERAEAKQQDKIRRMMRMAAMTEEEKAERRMKSYMTTTAKLSSMSREELEELRKKKAERARLRRQKMEKSERRVLYERSKRWRQNLEGEKLERARESLKQAYYRKMERAKQDPELMAKIKREWKQGYERQKDPNRKKRLKPGETEEMRLARRREKKRLDMKKFNLKRRLERQKLLESGVPMEQIRSIGETPEARERRLLRNRMYRSKQTLRDQLTRQGASPETIKERLAELVANWTPSSTRADFRPYKSRSPKTLKPLEPEELKLLAEEPKQKRKSTEAVFTTPPKVVSVSQPDNKPKSHFTPFTTPSSSTGGAIPGSASSSSSFLQLTSSSGAQDLSYQHHLPVNPIPNYQGHFLNYAASTSGPAPSTSSAYLQNHTPFFSAIDYQAQSYCSSSQDDCSTASVGGCDDDYHDDNDYYSPDPTPPPPPQPPAPSVFRQLDSYFGFDKPSTSQAFVTTAASVLSTPKPKSNRGRPRKRPEKPKLPPGVPRPQKFRGGKHANAIRDKICEICGNMYSSFYIADHKLCTHNPNYQNGKCVLCGEEFKSGRKFYYDHWLRVHKVREIETNPDGTPKEMYMCDICGAGPYYKKGTFYMHKHYTHGNYETDVPCEHCKKIFKTARSLHTHIRKYHKDLKKSVAFWSCLRCEAAFSVQQDLKEHVRSQHQDSFFPCPEESCEVFKYTEANMKFHWSKCPKRDKTKEKGEKKKKDGEEVPSIEKIQVPCEICGIQVQLSSLTRHYHDIHGITDELFKCLKCPKTFKRREFWVAHLEMLHSLDIDDIRDEINKYNVSDRSKVEIKNKEGGHKGLPAKLWNDGEWLKTKKPKKPTGGRRGRPPGPGSASRRRGTGRGRGRPPGRASRGRGIGRGRKTYSSEEEDEEKELDLDSESDPDFVEEDEQRVNNRGKRRGRALRIRDDDIEIEKRLVISIVPLTEAEITRFVGEDRKKADEPPCDDDDDDDDGGENEIEMGEATSQLPKVKVELDEVAVAVSPLPLDFELRESAEDSLPIPNFMMD